MTSPIRSVTTSPAAAPARITGESVAAATRRAVLGGRLDTIAREMGLVLERSARSPIFAEALDFSCGICDEEGAGVAQLTGIPILAGAGPASVRAVLDRYGDDIADGDAFIVNDPYYGGNHLPDIGIVTPVFAEGRLLLFCVSRAHHGDVGGSSPGSYNPRATDVFQEGVRIPPTRIARAGEVLDDVLELIAYNTRNPGMLRSDLLAQLGANVIGRRRLLELSARYSADGLRCAVADLLERSEALARRRISELPDGVYDGEEEVDDDGFQEARIRIRARVEVRGDRLRVDFAGTDRQVQGFLNCAPTTTVSAATLAVLWALGSDVPRNGGSFRAIEVEAPKGSLLNPDPPAPVTLSTLTPAGEIIAAVFRALAGIAGDRLPAGFARFCGPSFFGLDPRTDRFYVGFAFCALGGGGAAAGLDGLSYMSPLSNHGGVRTPNIEANELQYPHLTLRHELEPDSAGAGRHRGGAGVRYEIEFQDPEPGIVMFGDGMKVPPYGLRGGAPGSVNRAYLTTTDGRMVPLESKGAPRSLRAGDRVTVVSSGGGGFGLPRERDPEAVRADVLDGVVTPEAARALYGLDVDDPAAPLMRDGLDVDDPGGGRS